ncbi:hypothetical protein [Haloarcula vallismortis]|uniref:hypothetical protein n=1 Tax=Haloarcula vallismortis TaxID=28442 RepID=UPI0011142B95|nr:hypothetical protein [Haloarcula vallismortis]
MTELEEIEIVLDDHRKGIAQLNIYPQLDLAVYNIAVRGGLFSSGNLKSQAITLSELDVSLEELRELEGDEE